MTVVAREPIDWEACHGHGKPQPCLRALRYEQPGADSPSGAVLLQPACGDGARDLHTCSCSSSCMTRMGPERTKLMAVPRGMTIDLTHYWLRGRAECERHPHRKPGGVSERYWEGCPFRTGPQGFRPQLQARKTYRKPPRRLCCCVAVVREREFSFDVSTRSVHHGKAS